LDFETGAHNFWSALELCKEVGLYVIFHPGPYVNAEANAGGYPPWITTGAYGTLRNNDTRYTNAWRPFFDEVSSIVSEYQITNGGTVITYQIENELGAQWCGDPRDRVLDTPIADYMEKLEAAARESGNDVPTQANAANLIAKSWSGDFALGAPGNVDSSPISESRALTAKYAETKLVGMFFKSAKDLTVTEWIGNETN